MIRVAIVGIPITKYYLHIHLNLFKHLITPQTTLIKIIYILIVLSLTSADLNNIILAFYNNLNLRFHTQHTMSWLLLISGNMNVNFSFVRLFVFSLLSIYKLYRAVNQQLETTFIHLQCIYFLF